MELSDFLPGLGAMLEQRLGRFGYHIGTAISLSAALFIILLPIGMIGAGVFAVTSHVQGTIQARDALAFAEWFLVLPFWIVSVWLLAKWMVHRNRKALDERERRLNTETNAQREAVWELIRDAEGKNRQLQEGFARFKESYEHLAEAWRRYHAALDKMDGTKDS